MRHYFLPVALGFAALALACSPSLNWREVRPAKTALLALFPCKPEEAERRLAFGENTVLMRMLVCEADEATFTLAYADLNPDQPLNEALEVWQAATLRQAQAQAQALPSTTRPFALQGANTQPPSSKVVAHGVRPDGRAVTLHAVWFAQGRTVFQAAIYSSSLSKEAHMGAAETYFSGLKFQ